MSNSFSEQQKTFGGDPQGSIVGPLLSNILLNEIFLSLQNCDLANYADDSTVIHPLKEYHVYSKP